MFSHELLDFVPTPHPADALSTVHPHDAHLDPLFDSYIDSSYLDQSFCSDFSCCGQILPDLHRLLEHFEEQHVLPFPTDSRPLYSSPVYAQPRSAASAPYASYILSYPQSDPPLQPVSHPISSAHYRPRALPDLDLSRIPPVPDLSHSPLSPLSNSSSAYSSPSLGEPICLPPSLFTVQPSRPRSPPRSPRRDRARVRDTSDKDDDDQEARHTPTAKGHAKPSSGAGPQRTAKHYSAARVDPTSRSRPVARTPERATLAASAAPPSPASKRRDGREKAYKCPVSVRFVPASALSPSRVSLSE
ncbi:hypothetical protein BD309DRAFT_43873 [Dichomitus squalens]|nr:hypothetical protein BD309DRAFT_43873 [Dichomitus squalens]